MIRCRPTQSQRGVSRHEPQNRSCLQPRARRNALPRLIQGRRCPVKGAWRQVAHAAFDWPHRRSETLCIASKRVAPDDVASYHFSAKRLTAWHFSAKYFASQRFQAELLETVDLDGLQALDGASVGWPALHNPPVDEPALHKSPVDRSSVRQQTVDEPAIAWRADEAEYIAAHRETAHAAKC